MSSAKPQRYRLATIITLVLLAAVGVAVLAWVAAGGPWGDVLFKAPSTIQVLASDDELWVFAEITWVVRSGSPLIESQARAEAHEQYAVRFDGNTWHPGIRSPSLDGMTFNKNISQIMRMNNQFYQMVGPSLGRSSSVLAWDGNSFVQLQPGQSERIERSIGITGGEETLAERIEVIDRTTRKAGWDMIFRENNPFIVWESPSNRSEVETPVRFRWKQQEFAVIRVDSDDSSSIRIITVGRPDIKPHDLARFESGERRLTRKERRLLTPERIGRQESALSSVTPPRSSATPAAVRRHSTPGPRSRAACTAPARRTPRSPSRCTPPPGAA
jgi:hypothetical protein